MPQNDRGWGPKTSEERFLEWLAIVGIPLAALGYFLAGFLPEKELHADFVLKALGLALFLGGVFGSSRLLVKRVDKLGQDLNKRIDRLDDQHPVASTYRDILDLALSFGADESMVPVRAASQALRNVVRDHIPYAAASVKSFYAGHPNAKIEIREYSPIFELMSRLVEVLPVGSVWLGVTHLNQAQAWADSADTSFKDYRQTVMSRSLLGELTVFRIFCVQSGEGDKLERLKPIMLQEAKSRIGVASLEAAALPPDVSVLYLPPAKHGGRGAVAHPPPSSPDRLQDIGYRALCVLEYHLSDGILVHNVLIHPGSSEAFRAAEARFRSAWASAKKMPPDQPPNPASEAGSSAAA